MGQLKYKHSLLGRLGTLLARLGAILGASWAVLGPSWRPLGPSWSIGKPKTRKPRQMSKTNGKAMIFASWGPLGRPLGGFLGRLGSFLDRLEAILGVSKLFCAVWRRLGAILSRPRAVVGRLEAFYTLERRPGRKKKKPIFEGCALRGGWVGPNKTYTPATRQHEAF